MNTIARIKRGIPAVLLAGELCVLLDMILTVKDYANSGMRLAILFVLLSTLFIAVRIPGKYKWIAVAAIPALCALAVLSAILIWKSFLPHAVYQETDFGKEALYGGKRVMLVVPHEDDDQNVLGGVLEQYVKYGSEVYVVFLTNGDKGGAGLGRIQEAIDVMGFLGIPEEHVIFLGYGDQWAPSGPHIYNAEADRPMTSYYGRTQTYGTDTHPAYNNGHLYTRQNLLDDLCGVILAYEPDVLFGCDFDGHADHMATSLFFEEAMGLVLAQKPGYTPLVLKGFAYSTAFYNPNDYYRINIGATQNPYATPYMPETNIYKWADRLRLPVAAPTISRSIENAGTYLAVKMYRLQSGARDQAFGIINGDKVFWQRDTSSLSYTAQVRVSSGEARRLNDFKLADSDDLIANGRPYDGAWVPAADDGEKSAELRLAASADVAYICLYDNPSETDNVLDALISFDDGSEIHTGPLDALGAATEIAVDKKNVSAVTVRLLETEGERAGLTEIELYSRRHDYGLRFIKLQNADEDFVYDYSIDRSGAEDFTLYAQGYPAQLSEDNYTVRLDGKGCSAQIVDGKLHVECPRGKRCLVTLTSADGKVSDSALIASPDWLQSLGQQIEAFWRFDLPKLRYTTICVKIRTALQVLGINVG